MPEYGVSKYQYGSPERGLYSDGIRSILSQRGQLPPGFRSQIPQIEQEVMGMLPFGGITRAEQVGKAVQILRSKPFHMKGSSRFGSIEREYRKAVKKFHPDVRGPEAEGTMQVLNRAMSILRNNRDILRDYGIF